jgi:hypothetical protein
MLFTIRKSVLFAGLLALSLLWACTGGEDGKSAVTPVPPGKDAGAARLVLDVYKSPSCGCCGKWMEHLDAQGVGSVAHDAAGPGGTPARMNIPAPYRACHTAVSSGGYVFEGHIPARYIKQFLHELPPGAVGLAVPGMPVGSPGMEQGEDFTPYQVLLLKADGTHEVYASVNTYGEQY